MTWTLHNADCIEVMAEMEEASVDAVVCDPPYGLEFMGKEWDGADGFRRSLNPADADRNNAFGRASRTSPEYRAGRVFQEWSERWATEALRILKPGGHLLAFGGTRTYHRLACAIEDAGFEIRDSLLWLYGSGFPKSLDVSKAIDKAAGAEREVVGSKLGRPGYSLAEDAGSGGVAMEGNIDGSLRNAEAECAITAPATPEAQRWQGWGTALKPSHEPIVVARKPLIGTVAENVLRFGTGAINVDGCRIEGTKPHREVVQTQDNDWEGGGAWKSSGVGGGESTEGRWPANVVLSERAAEELDAQSGERQSGKLEPHHADNGKAAETLGAFAGAPGRESYGDTGGASRFFYQAKASRGERNAGLEGLPATKSADDGYGSIQRPKLDRAAPRENWEPHKTANHHPTVKPINLMRWLVRLVTPPGGIVLDPFTGSGTTGAAAVLEGFDFIGCEREAEYVAIAEARIAFWAQHEGREVEDVLGLHSASVREKEQREAEGQASLLDGLEATA